MFNYIKSSISVILFLNSILIFSQSEYNLYNFPFSKISADYQSINSYKKIEANLKNKSSDNLSIDVPCGTVFKNSSSGEQNLVVIFRETIYLDSRERRSREITTACMDASKIAPTNHSNWTVDNDRAIGDLIRFYHNNISIISIMTGAEHHATKEKKAAFLQMSVWAYYDADKKYILSFATKYMFNGNKEEAELFVDATLPLIKIFTNYYKEFNKD